MNAIHQLRFHVTGVPSPNGTVELGSATGPVAPVGVSPTGSPRTICQPAGAFLQPSEVSGGTPKTAGGTPRASKRIESFTLSILAALVFVFVCAASGEIPKPNDAPKPLSPTESAKQFRLPPGFMMKLLAAEPLIPEPSGVCWDERGRLFVCELHGYNLEGQYDIEELNKTGQLDMVVRRIQADEKAKQAAKAGTYGTVKLLLDRDGDGRMDDAIVWADKLPPCYGLVPARGGIIVACATDIMFLKDADGDGKPDVRETIFTGFDLTILERAMNCPQWGLDNWIYCGAGPGGTITGPRLKTPLKLGRTNFRFRPDGSAIEPVEGSTKTIGLTFTEGGDWFVAATTHPGYFVTPLPWRYLGRNSDCGTPAMDAPASDYQNVFPAAPPHPWRTRRADHAEYAKYYRDRYGSNESDASGWFTSGCSPLVYQDDALPGLRGRYLVCEPAQNLVHLATIERDQTRLRLKRTPPDAKREFLASADPWFHAIALDHAPDGAVAVVDFYREIIEDYSAIPRHLQQQYGLVNGRDRGRLWLLTHRDAPVASSANMTKLSRAALAQELASPRFWRRQTARRLLIERQAKETASAVQALLASARSDTATALGALYTLEGWDALRSEDLLAAWRHPSPDVKRHALRLADTRFAGIGKGVEEQLLAASNSLAEADPRVALQAALSLGESGDPRMADALAALARAQGDVRWLNIAVISSARDRERDLVARLVPQPGRSRPVLQTLVGAIAARGNQKELEQTRALVRDLADADLRAVLDNLITQGMADAQPLPPGPAPEPVRLDPPTAEQLADLEKLVPQFVAALGQRRDVPRGRDLFRDHCAGCHRAKGLGNAVGPDLDAEFQRAEEVILRDVLFPSEKIRPGFETYLAQTRRGEVITGVLASESPTSLTLRVASGTEVTFLRKRLLRSGAQKASLMPSSLGQLLEPKDVADIISFLHAQ